MTDARIRGFDGLRAIAVIYVFIEHRLLIQDGGQFGVWVFFLLSGCLITRILAREREAIEDARATPGDALKRFYWRRTLRIFPAYYALLAVVGLVSVVHPIEFFSDGGWRYYWLYASNVYQAHTNTWAGSFSHFWTLAVEEQFYLFFAPLVLLAPRARTAAICLILVVLGLAVKAGLYLSDASELQVYVNSFVNFYILAMGGLVGLWSLRGLPAWLGRAPVQAAIWGAFLIMPFLFYPGWSLSTVGQFTPILGALGLAALMAGQQTWVTGLLELWPMRALGRISYGFYLFHNLLPRGALLRVFNAVHLDTVWLLPMFEFAVSVGLAAISWLCFERVFLRYRHALDAPSRQGAVIPQAN